MRERLRSRPYCRDKRLKRRLRRFRSSFRPSCRHTRFLGRAICRLRNRTLLADLHAPIDYIRYFLRASFRPFCPHGGGNAGASFRRSRSRTHAAMELAAIVSHRLCSTRCAIIFPTRPADCLLSHIRPTTCGCPRVLIRNSKPGHRDANAAPVSDYPCEPLAKASGGLPPS